MMVAAFACREASTNENVPGNGGKERNKRQEARAVKIYAVFKRVSVARGGSFLLCILIRGFRHVGRKETWIQSMGGLRNLTSILPFTEVGGKEALCTPAQP